MVALRFIVILFFALLLQSCQTNDWQVGGTALDETDRELFKSWQILDAQFDCCAANIWDANYRP